MKAVFSPGRVLPGGVDTRSICRQPGSDTSQKCPTQTRKAKTTGGPEYAQASSHTAWQSPTASGTPAVGAFLTKLNFFLNFSWAISFTKL